VTRLGVLSIGHIVTYSEV